MHTRTRFGPLALLALFSAAPAWAQEQDTLKLQAGYTLRTDSNLYRLSSTDNAMALLGRDSAAERIGISSVGLSFNKAYSLQRLELDVSLVDYSYQNFDNLSFTATNYTAAWRWSLTPRVHGSLTTDRAQTLNSFSDYQGVTQNNQRTNNNTAVDATYDLDGNWHLLGSLAQARQTNQVAVGTGDDYSTNSASVGVRYAPSAVGDLTYNIKTSSGKYLNRSVSAAGFYDSEFSQLSNELRLHWVISGDSSAILSATYLSRSHPNYAQRDFSGFNTGATVNWNITGKTALSATYAHDIASYQTSYASYRKTDRLSVGPTWQVSAKTYLGLKYDVARIDYLGAPTPVPLAQRQDTTRDTTLSFNWAPYHYVMLSASLQKSTRDATVTNLPALDYTSDMATLSAQFSF